MTDRARQGKISLIREEHFVEALDPGIRLHLREKRPRGLRRPEAASTLLFIHGQSTPAPVAFDLPLPGYSWMDFAASRGFDVFGLSIRGYGLSTRPSEMEENPEGQSPVVRGLTAVRDIQAAVSYILKKREVKQLNLLGWSWGTTTSAAFAASNPERVRKLVLYAPFYAYDDPARAALFEDPSRPGRLDPRMGAWRWVTEKEQRGRWDAGIPKGQRNVWREERVMKAWWEEQLRFDAQGRSRRPRAVRVPNGPMADLYDRTRNRPIFDPGQIRCPALLILGDHDQSCREAEVAGLFRALAASRGKRQVIIGDATHFLQLERRREELFREVQLFLET